MKIAILVLEFPPQCLAGTGIATYHIAKHLAKRGHEVHVITPMDKGLPGESTEDGFYTHRPWVPRIRFLRTIFFYLKALLLLKQINPEVVHGQEIGTGICGRLEKKFLKKPYVIWGQGSDIYLTWLLKRSITSLVMKEADAVIALTADMKQEMKKFYNKGICVIPNGIELESFQNLSRQKARQELQIREDDKIILFTGTLRPVKGVKYLIEAMKIVRQKDKSARLILVGDGEERQDLEELAGKLDLKDVITFTGKIPHEKVAEHMAASDIFVLPSLSEGFPVVILEAMACGLPVVTTEVRGLPEIVRDGENGFLIQPKKPGEIAEQVILLLEDDKLREKMSRNNRRDVHRYSWDEVVKQLEVVYSSVLRNTVS